MALLGKQRAGCQPADAAAYYRYVAGIAHLDNVSLYIRIE